MTNEPALSDIAQRASNDSLRELTVRHVKAGYSNVYKYAIALEAERDALLAVARAIQEESRKEIPVVSLPKTMKALAALPEYLR